ncbi:hypothetical protein C1646_670499 [Rhizophagus diaphanus]|nr:hypothetical protein C1646_670499 [Rhizophagus diaphanus] [Rhizophagus sp. MUCL 43196]
MEITLHTDETFNKNNVNAQNSTKDNNKKNLATGMRIDDIDHNKKSGNNPIEVRYKAEVEEILNGNRPSLAPKLIGSSLDLEVDVDVQFNEVTGRSKRKNRSDESTQEEPRKANR